MQLRFYFLTIFTSFFFMISSWAQDQHFEFQRLLKEQPNTIIPTAIPFQERTLNFLLQHPKEVQLKKVTKDWIYINATPTFLSEAKHQTSIPSFHIEYSLPQALNDSTRLKHHVNEVHEGQFPLPSEFSGKGVLVGFVDTGLDYNHPDFQLPDGTTRVLYYWDQGMPINSQRTPQPYGYGQLFTKQDILNGTCEAIEDAPDAHGSTVAGAAVSNGRATGREKGMAPDAQILVFETDFSIPNWTLTVADACDFLFKVADSLGMPAVMNLSVGSYLGSHDGNDPAADLMEELLENSSGRAIICAAGNSGSWGKYHLQVTPSADTNFVWFAPNKQHQLGQNAVYFDLWSDSSDRNWNYGLSVYDTTNFTVVSSSAFRSTNEGWSTVIRDTLRASNQSVLAVVEWYPEMVYGNYHLEGLIKNIDTNGFYIGFHTFGVGKYDLWSGSSKIGLTDMVTSLPSSVQYPEIVNYSFPDSLSTVVSSWACSDRMITTGNLRNRYGHVNGLGNYFVPTYNVPVGGLTIHSSKGPTRHGLIKPDITACGDMTLSAGPAWILQDPNYLGSLSDDMMHVRNGGTSMASPVIAGIAALYFEKCQKASIDDFKNDLSQSAIVDGLTGAVPNNAYGYGKVNAFDLLNRTNYTAHVEVPPVFCFEDSVKAVSTHTLSTASWSFGQFGIQAKLPITEDTILVSAMVRDQRGCLARTDTVLTIRGNIPPLPQIERFGNVLKVNSYNSITWFRDGMILSGENGSQITIDTTVSALYQARYLSVDGCTRLSIPFDPTTLIAVTTIQLFPNPVIDQLTIMTTENIEEIVVIDASGKLVKRYPNGTTQIDCSGYSDGTYTLLVKTGSWQITRFVKSDW